MKTARLENMTKGWFVGDFYPTLYRTQNCEVAIKTYKEGDYEESHYHKVATEITVVISGRVKMFGRDFSAGDIIIVEPDDVTDFTALTDVCNCVVKIPGVKNDKYLEGE